MSTPEQPETARAEAERLREQARRLEAAYWWIPTTATDDDGLAMRTVVRLVAVELREVARALLAEREAAPSALVEDLRRENHALKRAIAPSAAGPEPWEGMPPVGHFIAVAQRYRDRESRVQAREGAEREPEPSALAEKPDEALRKIAGIRPDQLGEP